MNHSNDDDFPVGWKIVKRVLAVEMHAEAGRKIIARRPHMGGVQERLERGLQLFHEARRVLWGVLSNERPDIGKVILGLVGYSEGAGSANRFLPF